MDFVYHGLVGLAVSKAFTGKYLLASSAFSVLPDILGATTYQVYKIKYSSKKSAKEFANDFIKFTKRDKFFDKYDKIFYRSTHSLVALIPVILVAVVFLNEKWWVMVLSYLSHLVIDVFTHEGDFSERLFYPFSDWNIPCKNWLKNKKLFFFFWAVLILVFLLRH